MTLAIRKNGSLDSVLVRGMVFSLVGIKRRAGGVLEYIKGARFDHSVSPSPSRVNGFPASLGKRLITRYKCEVERLWEHGAVEGDIGGAKKLAAQRTGLLLLRVALTPSA
jgi:hypothetical protein